MKLRNLVFLGIAAIVALAMTAFTAGRSSADVSAATPEQEAALFESEIPLLQEELIALGEVMLTDRVSLVRRPIRTAETVLTSPDGTQWRCLSAWVHNQANSFNRQCWLIEPTD